uniref:Transglutaminase-like domain-containing protein n=1 Tax=Mucochytrium quahogii TaxID=96639 RepID=A0A7S2WK67_9STRA|mmetsp:Transcript_9074/g.17042  ORF Transcript_9074/g.17042 Transcript_9074/m.17042 type:complete len:342 (+) Transcript_9074:814-1839(+)
MWIFKLLSVTILGVAYGSQGNQQYAGHLESWKRRDLEQKVLALLQATDPVDEIKRAVKFIVEHMPPKDFHDPVVTALYVVKNIQLAFEAKKRFQDRWTGENLPELLFFNDVLPYAVMREPRTHWRSTLQPFMVNVVQDCKNAKCAVLALNKLAWSIVDPAIIFVAAPPNMLNGYSVAEVMEHHNASCTGLTIFLVSALRSVGIPARAAGVPHWHKGPKVCPDGDSSPECGNHNWVEVFADGAWYFVDQRGVLNELNKGWFFPDPVSKQYHSNTSLNHSVFATSWAPSHTLVSEYYYKNFTATARFPMVWDWDTHVNGWETVAWYNNLTRSSTESGNLAEVK